MNYDAGLNAVIGELAQVEKFDSLPLFIGTGQNCII